MADNNNMKDIIFSLDNVTDFSNSLKEVITRKKSKKVKEFLVHFPMFYKDMVTKFSENMDTLGFKGNTQFKANSITSKCMYDKCKITLIATPKIDKIDVIGIIHR